MANYVICTEDAATYRTLARGKIAAAHESFERCDTDGCVSQYVDTLTSRLYLRAAEVAEDGGAHFTVLQTLDGRKVEADIVNGRYGMCWRIKDDSDADKFGRFAPIAPARKTTLSKRGLQEGDEWVPAKFVAVRIASPQGARGFSGLTSCYIKTEDIRRWKGQD